MLPWGSDPRICDGCALSGRIYMERRSPTQRVAAKYHRQHQIGDTATAFGLTMEGWSRAW